MRKITQQAIAAFLTFQNFASTNTTVLIEDNGDASLLLHGNLIGKHYADNGQIEITNAGWQSNVTKERLNGIPGVSINQRNWQWYLNGEAWDGEWITVNPGTFSQIHNDNMKRANSNLRKAA